MNERRNDLEIVKDPRNCLHDPTRIDLLFTMSEITHVRVHPDYDMRIDVSRTMIGAFASTARLRSSSSDAAAFATVGLAEP